MAGSDRMRIDRGGRIVDFDGLKSPVMAGEKFRFGLIGHPVSHSFSADYFRGKFENLGLASCSYSLHDLPLIGDFSALVDSRTNWAGFNVTLPYKQSIMPLLDEISPEAQEIGAVNVLVRCGTSGAKWCGHNTDAVGFQKSIAPFLEGRHERALVLGTGGSSKAVVFALDKLGITTLKVSREAGRGDCTYSDLTAEGLAHFPLIVNCTPVGMHPNEEAVVDLPLDGIGEGHLLVDLVYNPTETKLMAEARRRGATVVGGLSMLHLQADAAWELWSKSLNLPR
jgi:shikimate dehydrogenase